MCTSLLDLLSILAQIQQLSFVQGLFVEMDLNQIPMDSVISSIHFSSFSRRKEVDLPSAIGDLPISCLWDHYRLC